MAVKLKIIHSKIELTRLGLANNLQAFENNVNEFLQTINQSRIIDVTVDTRLAQHETQATFLAFVIFKQ